MPEIAALLDRAVVSLEPSASLRLAARLMADQGVGSVVVLKAEGGPAIITERDLLQAAARTVDFDATPLEAHMTKKAVTVAASLDVLEAATRMHGEGFRHLIVVEDDGSVGGVLSMRDLLGALIEQTRSAGPLAGTDEGGPRVKRVGDCMVQDVISVEVGATLDGAARAMTEGRVGAAIVMEGERVAGIITERDLMQALAKGLTPTSTRVTECMTRKPRTITPFTTAGSALSLMLARGFRHLPVMEDGKLVGIVSMRALASG